MLILQVVYRLRSGPFYDFGTERWALLEPTRFILLQYGAWYFSCSVCVEHSTQRMRLRPCALNLGAGSVFVYGSVVRM